MTKTELLHGLAEWMAEKEKDSKGIANIIQLTIDILLEDIKHGK